MNKINYKNPLMADNNIYWDFLLEDKKKPEIFLYPFLEYLEEIFTKFNTALLGINHDFNNKSLKQLIARDIKVIIYRIVQRSLIWEFTLVNRNKNKIKFVDFIKELSKPDQLSILFNKYPVMKEILLNSLTNYLNFQLEFIERLKNDLNEILFTFTYNETISLNNIEMMGDPHCSGKRTLLLTFTDKINAEKNVKIIYKPRSVTLDKKFQDFIVFINSFIKENFLSTIKIIDKEKYGWEEYVEHKPIKTGMERNFYYQIGCLLGIIYSLNGHDMHFENVIANGNIPILIDLECLLSIPINDQQDKNIFWPSVGDTALIPTVHEQNKIQYDFSALLFHGNQISPNQSYEVCWNSETAIIEKKKHNVLPAKNYLYYTNESDSRVNPGPFLNDIIKGFEDYLKILIKNKTIIIDFIQYNFPNLLKRVIIRPTFVYDRLMSESYHPKLLSNKEGFIKYLDQLYGESKMQQDIYKSEVSDMLMGDIPCFFSKTDEAILINSRGEYISYLYLQNGIERLIKKIKLLDKNELNVQCQYIKKAMEYNYAQ